MNSWPAKIAVLALLVAALVAGGLWLAGDNTSLQPEQGDATASTPAPSTGANPASAAAAAAASSPVRQDATPERTVADQLAVFPQGFRGRVLNVRGQPLTEVRVYLVESAFNDPGSVPMLQRQGLLMGPVTETVTDADGRFALGLHLATDKLYEVQLLAEQHADVRLGELRVLPRQWHDLGDIRLARGTTIRGSVTVADSHLPVPFARVALESASAFAAATLRALPGRENGRMVRAAADGTFELPHAPARGLVNLSATAPGFAQVLQQDVDLGAGDQIEVHFQLPRGRVLAGQVVDPSGQPLQNVRLEAWPQDAALPPCVGHSQADGSFTVSGLREEPHRLRVMARGYRQQELPDLAAGRRDLQITLQPSTRVAVTVRTPSGRVLRDYRVGLRRWFDVEGQPLGQLGRVSEVPDQRVRLAGNSDRCYLLGAPAGQFVVQVIADGWAKSVSPRFEIAPDSALVTVTVELVAGATLRGVVTDERLQPLANATVTTQIDGARPDNPMWRMLARVAPDRITTVSVTTGPDGAFLLPRLAFGNYQLQIEHADACRRLLPGIALSAPTITDLGAVRLTSGAVIFGHATAAGRVAGQIKVVLSTVLAPDNREEAASVVRLETVTDPTGAFTMPRRVPAGEYELRAAAVDTAGSDSGVFDTIHQMQRSALRLRVVPGQSRVEQNIDIPARRP